MKDNGFVSLNKSNYSYFLKDTSILLFPAMRDEFCDILYKYYGNYSWTINLTGSKGVRGAVWKHTALIKTTNSLFNDVTELKAKCVFSRWDHAEVGGFELFGEAIDDLFFLSDIFSRENELFPNPDDPEETIIDRWTVSVGDRIITVEFLYGNILSFQGRNHRDYHPFFRVKVSGNEDLQTIYNAYLSMMSFIKIIRYRSTCGKMELKLLGRDSANNRIGSACLETDAHIFQQRYELPNYDFWKGCIQNILNLVFCDISLCLDFYPEKELYSSPEDYAPSTISKLFTAFENECHKNKELFEKIDCSNVANFRERLIDLLKQERIENLTEAEDTFLSQCIERIGQVGTQMGQTRKLINAFDFFVPIIEDIIKSYTLDYTNFRDAAIKYLKMIPSLRARILHDGDNTIISSEETTALKILETIVYAQILKRAKLSDIEIEKILHFNFEFMGGNYTYLIPDPC